MSIENRTDEALQRLFSDIEFSREPEGLYDPLRYMIAIGGKRLRPRICLLTYLLYKDTLDEHIMEPVAGLEVFHSFTLIHDDIMDKSPLRRNFPTVWKKWGEDTAILSGDVMCIDSFRRISMAPPESLGKVLSLFTETTAQVCEGQQLDMEFEDKPNVEMDEYIRMIGLKTGVLIACAAKMGALIAGAPEKDCSLLYDYGYNLGLAFQVADDYLDVYGDESVFGKPIGGDILNRKKSWLTIKAMERAGEEGCLEELIGNMEAEALSEEEKRAKILSVKKIYDTLGTDRQAQEEIVRLTGKALESAAAVRDGAFYSVLKDFADRLVNRSK